MKNKILDEGDSMYELEIKDLDTNQKYTMHIPVPTESNKIPG